MFRDAQEELERLQAQLLEETEEEEEAFQEEESEEDIFLDEEDFDELLSDADQGENPGVYQNFSNDYGRNLRNFATGYKAYNTDRTDVSPDEISEEVLEEKNTGLTWLWVLLIIMLGVIGVILWSFLSAGGLF